MERIRYLICDCETDGLNARQILCFSYQYVTFESQSEVQVTTDYDEMRRILSDKDLILVCHNIVRFDVPVWERILGITINNSLWDSLAVSWTLYPKRLKHGLEGWGEDLGVKKPKIDDWSEDNIEAIIVRCMEDVKINSLLFMKQFNYLFKIYDKNTEALQRYVNYLTYNLKVAREQETVGWKLDIVKAEETYQTFTSLIDEKVNALKLVMPEITKYKKKYPPKKSFKKDGSLSALGQKNFHLS